MSLLCACAGRVWKAATSAPIHWFSCIMRACNCGFVKLSPRDERRRVVGKGALRMMMAHEEAAVLLCVPLLKTPGHRVRSHDDDGVRQLTAFFQVQLELPIVCEHLRHR